MRCQVQSLFLSQQGERAWVCYTTRAAREKVPQRASMQKRASEPRRTLRLRVKGIWQPTLQARGPARVPGRGHSWGVEAVHQAMNYENPKGPMFNMRIT